jgi:uncharacterized membrane protein YhaH (DUF805 family)
MDGYRTTFRRYAVFDGRAGRSEFWCFTLINAAVSLGIVIVDSIPRRTWGALAIGLVGCCFYLIVALPWLGVTIRRLHDTDRSGWWFLLELVPFGIVFLVWMLAEPGDPGSNRYGPLPVAGVG